MAGSFAGFGGSEAGEKNFVIQKGEGGEKISNLGGETPKRRGLSKEQQEEAKVSHF